MIPEVLSVPSPRRVLVVVAVALALGGCTSDADDPAPESDAPVVQLGGPGESNRTLAPDEIDDLDAPAHSDVDVAFVQAMLPHHRQALEMTALVDARTASKQVPLLAERIAISQTDEIAQLEEWLLARDEPLPEEHAHHDDAVQMPGMLTRPELTHLRKADGHRFDRLFLQYMIRHHEGAVRMVEELMSEAGGQEPMVFQLAAGIESDQLVEIARMKRLLASGRY